MFYKVFYRFFLQFLGLTWGPFVGNMFLFSRLLEGKSKYFKDERRNSTNLGS